MGRLPATMYETISVADRLRRSDCSAAARCQAVDRLQTLAAAECHASVLSDRFGAALTEGSGRLKRRSPLRPGPPVAEQAPQALSASSQPGKPGG